MIGTTKVLTQDNISYSKTLLHENIPITGTLLTGTYSEPGVADSNIKEYAHGMFQSVFDYPFNSSSANHIFDLTFGVAATGDWGTYHAGEGHVGLTTGSSIDLALDNVNAKKNIYSEMSQYLVGFDESGSVRLFDSLASNQTGNTNQKLHSAVFLNFSRLVVKDEIQKGTFEMNWCRSDEYSLAAANSGEIIRITDSGSQDYVGPAGDYRILYAVTASSAVADNLAVGLLFRQAGVAVLELSASDNGFRDEASNLVTSDSEIVSGSAFDLSKYYATLQDQLTTFNFEAAVISGTINEICNGVRNRIAKISFKNTTEIQSAVYQCEAKGNEFNFSSNPTYKDVDTGAIVIRKDPNSNNLPSKKKPPFSYITSVGLVDEDNTLLAVAKLSRPEKKSAGKPFNINLRLDY